jgi:hypothetical protein
MKRLRGRLVLGRSRDQKPTSTISPKDYLAITISLVALAISAFTAYFTVVRQTDDLRVISTEHPHVRFSADKARAYLGGTLSLSFINAGTRPAIIHKTHIVLYVFTEQKFEGFCPKTVRDDRRMVFETDMAPLVLRERDIISAVVRPVVRRGPPDVTAEEDGSISFALPPGADYAAVHVCWQFFAATPSESDIWSEFGFEIHSTETTDGDEQSGPMTIYRRSGTIFDL